MHSYCRTSLPLSFQRMLESHTLSVVIPANAGIPHPLTLSFQRMLESYILIQGRDPGSRPG
jgi:hypothetical protein